MLQVTVLCVGSLKERYWKEACAEYSKRLTRFCRFNCVELEEYKLPGDPSPAQIEKCVEEEGIRLLSRIPEKAGVAALCIEGKQVPSEGLSELLAGEALNGSGQLFFVIGGSYGLSGAVKKRAKFRLSMSEMTFPHQLARVMLFEQLYRGFMIQSGGKYHK